MDGWDDNADDHKPFMILNYGNGEGYFEHLSAVVNETNTTEAYIVRQDVNKWNNTHGYNYTDFQFKNPSPVPLDTETHGGSDVGIYAIGPYSHLFQSVHEQNYIAYVMSYSACVGPHKDDSHCNHSKSMSNIASASKFIIVLSALTAVSSML